MQEKSHSPIKDADFIFENTPIRVVANRNCPKIELVGLTVGPFEEGNEYEVRFWVATELEKAGIIHPRRETLTVSRLYPILHRERVQPIRDLSSLPEDFYPRLRRLLESLKDSSTGSPEKMREYGYVENLSKDIVSCRLKKIVSLASTPGQKTNILRKLTVEELKLYEDLNKTINEWEREIL